MPKSDGSVMAADAKGDEQIRSVAAFAMIELPEPSACHNHVSESGRGPER